MKKTAIILFLVLAVPALLTSCLFDEEELFDKPASERIEAAKNEAKSVLEAAENGWHVRYFPSPTQEFGGYNLFFKFADGSVTVASEIESDPATTETSLYSLGEDLGVTLNFDTKNSLINYFTHPKNPDGMGSSYKGMEGDYKFTVMEASADTVILRGIITGNYYFMTPVPSGVSWASELETYRNNSEDMAFNNYSFVIDGTTYPATISNRRFTVKIDAETNLNIPFIYTKTGISFYLPIQMEDKTLVQDFTFTDDYYFTAANGADFKIMTPEPVRSDMTFEVTVPDQTKTYNSVTVKTVPSTNTEYYYMGMMLKSEFEASREKKLLQNLVAQLNSHIGSGDDPEVIAASLLHKGEATQTISYPSFYDEYVAVAFGCSVSNGFIVSTTPLTSIPFSVDASLLPDNTAENYKRWLGKWAVTSTSSETSGTSYTFYITVKPNVINSSYKITGWGYTTYANLVDITATYLSSTGVMRVTGNQADLYTTSTGTVYLANRYVNRDTGTGYGILNSTNAANLVATYGETGKAKMVGRNGSLTSGVNFTITSLEMYERRAGSTSYYYLPIASGYTSLDYFVGPYTMIQTVDAEGNVISNAPATNVSRASGPGEAVAGSATCTARE